jgi:CDP-ribitol ribitolphosphotransferase
MNLSKKILDLALKIVDACTFWIKKDPNRITFVSLTQSKLSSDFALIEQELQKKGNYTICTNLLDYKPSLKGKAQYFFNCLRQMVQAKKSALVILNDNNYVISMHKPKDLKVLQVWHACGAVKKFGNQIAREYSIQNYTAILSCSNAWKPAFAQAFGTKEEQVVSTGLARTDILLDTKEMDQRLKGFYEKYPSLKEKKLILYAPTFRGNIVKGMYLHPFDYDKLLDQLDDSWVLLYKYHPLLHMKKEEHARAIDVSTEDLYTLMAASSLLISDYSSVIFDYALLEKPMIAYVPDIDEYKASIGLNMDFKEFPGPVLCDESALAQKILEQGKGYEEKMQAFQNKYMPYRDGQNTQRIVKLIDTLMH